MKILLVCLLCTNINFVMQAANEKQDSKSRKAFVTQESRKLVEESGPHSVMLYAGSIGDTTLVVEATDSAWKTGEIEDWMCKFIGASKCIKAGFKKIMFTHLGATTREASATYLAQNGRFLLSPYVEMLPESERNLETPKALFTLPAPKYRLPKDIQNLIMFSVTTNTKREAILRDEYKTLYKDKKTLKSWLNEALDSAITIWLNGKVDAMEAASRRGNIMAVMKAQSEAGENGANLINRAKGWQAYAKSEW